MIMENGIKAMKARIFEIKRFAVHDGSGIRTTVFFKGCPLNCIWCHNPEGIAFEPQLAYYRDRCINCGQCISACEHGAHIMKNEMHCFLKENCVACGNCAEDCVGNVLSFYGREVTVDELLPLLLEDREFYENTDGGVTLSGGECLCQADFCKELLCALKENGIHTAVDTCGFVSKEAFDKVMPYTDVFLYDIKAIDEGVHIKCTGQPNKNILENLKYIDDFDKKIEVRIPYVPGYNSDQIEKIARFLSDVKNVIKVKVLPYHNYAGSKYASLGLKNTLPDVLPSSEEVEKAEMCLRKHNLPV